MNYEHRDQEEFKFYTLKVRPWVHETVIKTEPQLLNSV